MIKFDQLEVRKVGQINQSVLNREEWNARPWEKNVREESGDDGTWCGDCIRDMGG